MKRCPQCSRVEPDDALAFCRADGTALGELQSESVRRYVPSSGLAVVFAALGEKDKAFVWLEKDVTERTPRPPLFSVNPVFDDLRDDPRFQDLLRRIARAKID